MPDPTTASNAVSILNWTEIVMALGALGTAAYGLVDASKSLCGGLSRVGFRNIKRVISKLVPKSDDDKKGVSALGRDSVLDTLRANWMNGMAMADQKSVAKALLKLNLTTDNASKMADATGVDASILASIATKISGIDPKNPATALTPRENDVFGRFDLLLSSLLDQAYQRGDQRYRNWAKAGACVVAVILSLLATWARYGLKHHYVLAISAGLIATPLAPVAKDVASSIQAAAKVAQLWKK